MTPQQLDRFWARVEKTETCWIWLGAINKYGYGAVGINGKVLRAHRISWAIANGRTPTPKEFVCHSCDNRPCVNPGHLWLGDNRSNMADCVAKGRNSKPPHKEKSKHCKRGHPLVASNLYQYGPKYRKCKTCHIARSKSRYLKLKKQRDKARPSSSVS
jgi:hypothetical protein